MFTNLYYILANNGVTRRVVGVLTFSICFFFLYVHNDLNRSNVQTTSSKDNHIILSLYVQI